MCIPESCRVTVIQTDFGQWPTWDSSRTDLLYLGIPTNRLALPGTPHEQNCSTWESPRTELLYLGLHCSTWASTALPRPPDENAFIRACIGARGTIRAI